MQAPLDILTIFAIQKDRVDTSLKEIEERWMDQIKDLKERVRE